MATRFSILLLLVFAFAYSFGQNNSDTLFVFVGQKLSIKSLPRPTDPPGQMIISYENYQAKYKIIQTVFGDYSDKKIVFNTNVQAPVKLTTLRRFKVTSAGRCKLTTVGRSKLTT